MSQAGGPSSIGAVSVDVVANNAQLGPGLKQAEGQVAASAAKMSGEAAKTEKSFVQVGVEAQKSFRSAAGVITRTIGLIAAMGAAAAGVVKIIQRIADGFIGGEVAASKFFASVGSGVGKDAEQRLKATQDRIQKINEELAVRPSQSIAHRLMNSGQALKDEQRILIDSLGPMRAQLEAQRKRRFEEETRKHLLEEQGRETQRQVDSIKDGADELQSLRKSLANPAEQIQMELDARLKMADALRKSLDGMFAPLADQLEKAAKEAWRRSAEELKKIAQEAITEAMKDAIEGQVGQFGLQNLTTQLSQLNLKADQIKMAIPRRWK